MLPFSGISDKKTEKQNKAVALSHDPMSGEQVPRVIAKGMGSVADKIMDIAFANNVKVRQDADLVEILVALEVDTLIPIETYAAVAEILAYVYKANAAAGQRQKPDTD